MNAYIKNMTCNIDSSVPESVLSTEAAWMLKVSEVIQQEVFRPELSVSWVANTCHFSERHFSRKVRLLTGHPPSKLILEAKLTVALQLLKNKRATTVKAAAAMLHFSDVKYFSRRFQKHFGFYPSKCLQS